MKNSSYLLVFLAMTQVLSSPVGAQTSTSPVEAPTVSSSPRAGKAAKVAATSDTALRSQGMRLSLDEFLDQVRGGNQAFIGSTKAEEGASLRSDEWKLLTRPSLIAAGTVSDDRRETGSPIQGTGNRAQVYSLGIRQLTDFGLQGSLTYNYANTEVLGVPTQFLPTPSYFTAGPVLELSQSLWRNGWGRETRANQQAQSAQVQAAKFNESFRQTQILADAEILYWRLVLARQAVSATRDTVERAERLKEWSARRRQMELVDRADFLQSDAAVLSRSLELQGALDEEKAVARAFNTMRGVDADVVIEELSPIDGKIIEQLQIPERVQYRDDVKAAEQQKIAASAAHQLGIERNKPTLNVVGSIGLNGRDGRAGEAVSESVTADHPNMTIGVRLDMPLDFGTLKRDREGYRAELSASDLLYHRRVFEQERLWVDLTNRFKEGVQRLQLARRIEEAQREKMDYERNRHRRGRTTTYQVIQFEQDFANAQLVRIRAQADVLNIFAQLKTFGGGQ